MRETKTTNPQLIELIKVLRKTSREQNAPIWLDVADYLAKTRSNRITVNLSNINRHTEKADVVVVPGKILASGTLNHQITVASFEASTAAKTKLEPSKSTYITIQELLEKNPKGSKVKIIR
ncbi:MAG: 50S ribosomal protein L18e [Nitrososphaerota archaeon]|jgi:large subunit ribosomal protein L18e|uniref:50S ribosomal protein L18e n=1 Tax=Candidatus Bathycorpusculum sp. TaxID=2994959 RepID=UPI00281E5495|nr:50S ribosomal protein L18e [Candidatus Termitimicrobium sp.]MCL2432368.1 50S ribosomal protein L18e [Candidatus Termitimicrobium sp.]MDR0492698.1 50S ribosomal protein L18e [Nitrososphaerota archaeon]